MGFLAKLGIEGSISLFSTLFDMITRFVHAEEAANPNPGSGASKLASVLDKVNAVLPTIPAIVTAVEATGKSITDAAHAGDLVVVMKGAENMANLAVAAAKAGDLFPKAGIVQNAPSLADAAAQATADANTPGGTGG